MEQIKLTLLDKDNEPLQTSPAGSCTSLVYRHAYEPGDHILVESTVSGRFCVIQLEDTMFPALVYISGSEFSYPIPYGQQAIVYSPKSFQGECHVIRARFAEDYEISQRRNLAFNPYDQHGDPGLYPHAKANVETRGEAVFAAKNAIDGVFENRSHGAYPYQSWGINRDPNAELTLEFGRPVLLDELRLTLRGDYPHDNYWVQATVEFSDGTQIQLPLTNDLAPQRFPITPVRAEWLVLKNLIQAEGESPFPALTQIEAWGTECAE